MKGLCTLLACGLSALALPLYSQEAAEFRGGWIGTVNDSQHVLYLVLRENKVSGYHCFDCNNPDNLAFIDDGRLDADGLHFTLYHYPGSGAFYTESVDAKLQDGKLLLTLKKPESETAVLTLQRETPPPAPPPAGPRPNPPGAGRPRTLPAAAEQLTADKVLGLWLSGSGPTKQYFIFKAHKDGIRGMVCGPCDSALNSAPLENIRIEGSKLHFDIVHEDNGGGIEEYGPFSNVTEAEISMNELHMSTWPSYDLQAQKFEMTLLGPVQFMPTGK